jgi:hypothetical protein
MKKRTSRGHWFTPPYVLVRRPVVRMDADDVRRMVAVIEGAP